MIQKIETFFELHIAKFFKNPWFIAWLILPFIKPATEFTGKFDVIFDLLKIANCGIILLSFRFIIKKPSPALLLIGSLQGIFFISTAINGGRIWWSAVQTLSIFSLCALLEMGILLHKSAALKGFCIPLGLMALATVVTMFACYPNGLYTVVTDHDVEGLWHIPQTNNYLWGFDNSSAFKFIPAMIFFILATDPKSKKGKLITLGILFAITAAFVYVKAIMAILGCLLIFAYYVFLFQRDRIVKLLSPKTCVITICIIAVCLIGLNKNIPILQDIASGTDKVTSLNYRFIVWDNTMDAIADQPLLGAGVEEALDTSRKIGIDHPHNVFLDILYRGGLLAGLCFAAMLIRACKKSFKGRRDFFGNILAIGFFAYLAMAQMDYYNDQYLPFLLFILAEFTDLFIFNYKRAVPAQIQE